MGEQQGIVVAEGLALVLALFGLLLLLLNFSFNNRRLEFLSGCTSYDKGFLLFDLFIVLELGWLLGLQAFLSLLDHLGGLVSHGASLFDNCLDLLRSLVVFVSYLFDLRLLLLLLLVNGLDYSRGYLFHLNFLLLLVSRSTRLNLLFFLLLNDWTLARLESFRNYILQ